MTDLPPTIDYLAPLPSRPESKWPAILAWIVILSCVGFVMYRVSRAYKNAAEKGVVNPSAELQVTFAGKTAVGFKSMLGAAATTKEAATTAPAATQNADQMIAAMDKYAETPGLKARTIMVVGELRGADAALKRIEDLEKSKLTANLKEDLWALRLIYTAGVVSLDDASKERLIERYGFFGRLAAAYGLPNKEPARAKVLEEAQGSALRAIVLGVVFFALIGVVGVCAITAIVLAALGYFKRLYVPQPQANSAYLEAFALYLATFLGLNYLLSRFDLEALTWDWVALLLIPLMMAYARWRGNSADDVWKGFGFHWGRGPLIEIPCGIFGYLAGVPIIALGIFISLKLSQFTKSAPMHPLQKMLEGGAWHIVGLYLLASVYAPILEETMFRGAFFSHLRRRRGWLISASVVAFFFAAIHPQGWTFIPALGSIAIVLAALREWRGSLWASIAAHAANNGIVLTMALMATR